MTFADAGAGAARASGPVETRNGARIVPDRPETTGAPAQVLPAIGDRPPARALDDALRRIERRYGERTQSVVAMQLEYPRSSFSP